MAAGNGNGNQTQNNNMSRTTNNGGTVRRQQKSAPYKVYGTNEPYTGMTVEIGGHLYSTMGGALEGDSYQLIANAPNATPNFDPNRTNPPMANTNPTDMQGPAVIVGTGGTSGEQITGGPSNQNRAPDTQTGGGGGMY